MADSLPFKNGNFIQAINGLATKASFTDTVGATAVDIVTAVDSTDTTKGTSAVAFDNTGATAVYVKFNGTASIADNGFDMCIPAGLSKSIPVYDLADGTVLESISAISTADTVFNTVLHG